MACIEARGLQKSYGSTKALDGMDLRVEEGRILGLIGPNGAGKTTALNAILGLTPYEGELRVLGRNPWTQRELLMRDVSFIADVAVLPRWSRVWQVRHIETRSAGPLWPSRWWVVWCRSSRSSSARMPPSSFGIGRTRVATASTGIVTRPVPDAPVSISSTLCAPGSMNQSWAL